MIRCNETHIELSPSVAKALLAFSSHDKSRPNICGVGVSNGALGATDGRALVRFNTAVYSKSWGDLNGLIWPRIYVETQIRIAAAIKNNVVSLWFDNLSLADIRFPDLSEHIPVITFIYPSSALGEPGHPAFSAAYLGLLEIVARACTQDKETRGSKPKTPPCRIRNLGRALDPIVFEVGDNSGSYAHYALVIINPERV